MNGSCDKRGVLCVGVQPDISIEEARDCVLFLLKIGEVYYIIRILC